MAKFRKKPVVIEAVQWNPDAKPTDMPDWFWEFFVRFLEGTMVCSPGDWIIKGVKGELYPCKPDIFAATYEEEK